MKAVKIAFVGAGNMASSLIGGLIAKDFSANNISASDPYDASLQNIAKQYSINTTADNNIAIQDADVVVLAVKPQVMKPVAEGIAAIVTKQHALVISIAAGISLNSLQHWLGEKTAIVRCMPNTPALVQLGATGMFANDNVSETQKELAKNILDAVGISLWLQSERELDAVTALSGSGPAYYFLLMEAMVAAGIKMGLTSETAKQLTLQTALGAATMASQSGDSPAELRRKVTSPNGTTEQAIASFQKDGFEKIIARALEAAEKRSVSLSEELGKS